jgi:flagellar basal-body rod protein FlgG
MPLSFTGILNITRNSMLARLLDLDVRSHNLSNIQTSGYKSTRMNFQETLEAEQAGGVQISSTQRAMDQGSIRKTNNPLDMAIGGEGFFSVTLPGGETGYTRDGQFQLDANRQIVSPSGLPLVWEGQIPEGATSVHANPNGSIVALVGDTWTAAGQVQLTRFPNPSGLESFGQNVYLETEVSGTPQTGKPAEDGFGQIIGSALEGSNVNLADEMTSIIALERSFQMSVRAFQSTDQMMGQAIHMRRG